MTGDFGPRKHGEREIELTPEIVDKLVNMALDSTTTMTPELKERIFAKKFEMDREQGENNG